MMAILCPCRMHCALPSNECSSLCRRSCIEQSGLDGSNRQVVVESLVQPSSLAVFGHHVYWLEQSQSLRTSLIYMSL